MAPKRDTQNPEVVTVVTDGGNPPPFRAVLSGNVKPPRNAKDAKKLYGRLISQFIKGEVANEDAKTLCYLLTGYIQACAASDFEERVDSMEKERKQLK